MQTIEELNRDFGNNGRVAFREGPGGWPIAVLVSPKASCEVSLYGGQVLSYRAKGHPEALWLSPRAEFAEGKAIRGGIPVCWPWFGKAPEGFPEGTPSHGFARKALWRVVGSGYDTNDTELTLELTHEDATDPAWPYAYQLRLTVTLCDWLAVDLQTRNLDAKPFTYSESLHAYLQVGDARQAQLYGVEAEPLTFSDEATTDTIYPVPRVMAMLFDPALERGLGLAADDASAVVVWHPSLEEAPEDATLEGPRHFVCVEPANPHQTGGAITLAPGKAHVLSLQLQSTTAQDNV